MLNGANDLLNLNLKGAKNTNKGAKQMKYV
jgi:hypothetical protein